MIKIGDRCKTTKSFENFHKKFEAGIEVTIIEIDDIRGFGFIDDDGNKCLECGWSGFEKL